MPYVGNRPKRQRTLSNPVSYSGNNMFKRPGPPMSRRSRAPRSSGLASRVRALRPYKHSTIGSNSSGGPLLQNIFVTNPVTQNIPQGTDNVSRDGDEIHLASLKLSGYFSTPAASGAFSYRILVGFSHVQNNSFNAIAFAVSDLFLPNTGSVSQMDAIINPKAFTVLYDEKVTVPSVIPATIDMALINATVPLNQKFVYGSSGSVYGKFKNMYTVIIGYGVGFAAASNVGAYALNTDLVFQDSA